MLLTIDIGNSHSVFGAFVQGRLKKTWRVPSVGNRSVDSWKLAIRDTLGNEVLDSIQGVALASVVPNLTPVIQAAFSQGLGSNSKPIDCYVVNSQSPYSFQIRANPPEQVGIDRLVNAEAAVREYGPSCIIVDAGTATTLCAIWKAPHRSTSEFLGGAIIPGLKLGMEALASRAAQLFEVDLVPPTRAIGTNTREALQSGIILGYASMIDGMIRRFKDELIRDESLEADPVTNTTPVIATGGISHILKDTLKEVTHFDFDLTLKGISYLYESVCR